MTHSLLSTLITLFVVVDPIGSLPLFLSVTSRQLAAQRRKTALKSVTVAFCILFFFILLGQIIFKAIGVGLPAFQIAGGGIVLFLFGLQMIFGSPSGADSSAETGHDVAVFPLAVPSIATPGAILAAVVLTNNDQYGWVDQAVTTLVLAAVLLFVYLLFRFANPIQRVIGHTGAQVISRIMGMILTAAATESVIGAIRELQP